MSLKSQIESYVGSVPVSLSDADLQSYIVGGVNDIIRKVKLSDPNELWLFTRTDSVSSSGLEVNTSLIYDVALSGKPCEAIPVVKRHRAADPDSIEYATGEFPSYYVTDKKVFILPDPGISATANVTGWVSENGGLQTKVQCSTTIGLSEGDWVSISKSDESTSTETDKYYIGVHRIVSILSTDFVIERDFSDSCTTTNYNVTPLIGACSYVNIPSASDITLTSDSISYFPNQYIKLVEIYAAMGVIQHRMSNIYNNLPTLTLPVPPATPTLQIASTQVGDFTVPAPFVYSVPPTGSSIDYSNVPSRPTPTSVLMPPITSFTFPISSISVPAIDIGVLPVPPDAPSFGSGETSYTHVRTVAPTYVPPTMILPVLPEISDVELPPKPVPPTGPSFTDSTSSLSFQNIPVYIPAVAAELDFASAQNLITTEEDSELAAAQLQLIQSQIQEVQYKSTENLNTFNADMNEYKSKIDESLQNSANKLNEENQEFQAELAHYQAEVQTYQIETNNVIAKWGKEEIEVKFAEWQVECTNALQAYQNDIQNALNTFNKETTIYQAEVQKAAQDGQAVLTKDANEYQAKMTKYQAELEAYKSETSNQLTEWTSGVLAAEIQEFQIKRNDELQKWNTDNSLKLQKHTQEVQEASNKIGAEITIWQQEIQKAQQTFQAEDASELQSYQAKIQEEINRFDAELKRNLEDYNSDIQKLNVETAKVTEANQSILTRANFQLQNYTAESQNVVQDFQGKITNQEKEFNYYATQIQLLKNDYESGFIVQNSNKEQ